MKWLKIIGFGLGTAILGGASFIEANYTLADYMSMINSPLDFTAYVPAILLLMALLSGWQTLTGLFATPAMVKDIEKVGVVVEVVKDKVIEGRTVTQGEGAKTRLHTSEESDRIIEAITSSMEGLSGQEKLNFEKAAEHILTSEDERDRPVAEALEKGDLAGAVNLRRQRLVQEDAYFDDMNKAHADKWRDTGAMAYPVNTVLAREAYENAIKYDGTIIWDHIYLSRLYQRGGNLEAARATIKAGLSKVTSDRNKSVLLDEAGNVAVAQGDLSAARTAYQDGLEIATRLAKAGPSNTEFQRDLSVSYNKIGDVAVAQGDLSAARTAYQDGLEIRERIAKADPSNTEFQRDLSVSYDKIGNVAVSQGDLSAARTSYQDGLEIATRLAKADPSNTEFQRDLSVSYNKIGDVAVAQGDLSAARTAYQDGLEIATRLAKADPSNTEFQRDLSVSYERIGDVAVAQGDLSAARTAYQDGLEIRERLAKADPSNTGFQRDLSVSYNKIGNVAVSQGDLSAARTAYQDGLEIRERLAKADPSNTGLQRDLVVSHWNLATLGGLLPRGTGRWPMTRSRR